MLQNFRSLPLLGIISIGLATEASAVFIDGSGHYSIKPNASVNHAFKNRVYQAADQSFQFNAEIRANDQTSFFARFNLFPDEMSMHLGDRTQPAECYGANGAASGAECENAHQNTGEPGYRAITPNIVEAYGQYAFEYCLLQAGRRPRDWGLGIFMDSGHRPFSKARSVYDGVTCDINIQKSQTLGFSVGYDKLAESGGSIIANAPYEIKDGAISKTDDLDQFFLSVEFDDRKANAGAGFTRAVKIYFANVMSSKERSNIQSSSTDIKFADLFTGFYFYDLLFENEILFRLGRSADPAWARMGGVANTADRDGFVRNNVESIGLAGKLQYTLSRSGASIGPDEYNQGNQTSHSLFMTYAFAPGDTNGYKKDAFATEAGRTASPKAKAMAFHKNYQPALILFNTTASETDRVDGVFDPSRVMNTTLVSAGYKYESQQNGNLELKLLSATMNTSMPKDIKDQQANETKVQAGYFGNSLGLELDLAYDRHIGKDVSLGAAAAYAMPGDAWQTEKGVAPLSSYLLQSYVTWNF
jgi:hypothetical protein